LAVIAQDTTVVTADNPPVWGEPVRLVEEVRIGMLEGPDEYMFGAVSYVTVRPSDGAIFVFDEQVPILRRYDTSGEFVRNIGRDGEGPGEYRDILGMETLRDGRLAVWDIRNARITVYDTSGAYATSLRIGSGLFGAEVFDADDSGNYYVARVDMSHGRPEPGGALPILMIKLSPSGDSLDAIPRPEKDGPQSFVLATAEGYRGPFTEERVHALTRWGTWVMGRNTTYALDLNTPNGVRRIVRHVEPTAVARGERAQWEAWSDYFQRGARDRGRPVPDFPSVPNRKPFFRSLWVDADNRIWVGRYVEAVKRESKSSEASDTPPYEWREPPTYDVIASDGRFLGTVVLPKNTAPVYATGRLIWGVATGEMREGYVVRYRIQVP